MKVDDYRKEYEARLKSGAQAPRTSGSRFSTSALGGGQPAFEHVIEQDQAEVLERHIAQVRDDTQPEEARRKSLRAVRAATFLGASFDRHRPNYRQALRDVATREGDPLRVSALQVLAMEKDDVARDLLTKGLDDPGQAIVPPAKAIQLLGYDDHGVAVPYARRLLEAGLGDEVKVEALRVLASDPGSDELLAKFLSDTSEAAEVRSISAVALKQVNPLRFTEEARKIVVSDEEPESVRASCLGGLAQLRGSGILPTDRTFVDEVIKLQSFGPSEELRASASRYLEGQ
ncbi:MAG: hypothetical protein ACAH27_09570 [Xanthobacteraceae bacterium]